MTQPDENTVIALAAGVYEAAQPPTGIEILYRGAVEHVQFDVYRDSLFLYVVFVGSNQARDWARHLHFRRKRLGAKTAGSVHHGWLKDERSTEHITAPLIRTALECGYRLVFTGHSYGGPLATLAAMATAKSAPDAGIHLRTYGSPAVGNRAFADDCDRRIPDNIRYANPLDIVTKLPLGRYHHSGKRRKVSAGFPGHPAEKYREWIQKNPRAMLQH